MRRLAPILWNLWCLVSVIGIWPRWIEPRLLARTRQRVRLSGLSAGLSGLRVVQFSDLHLNPGVTQAHLDKLTQRISALDPDILLFTGDFLCYGRMQEPERLERFLKSLSARYGCFASLGNHDYERYVSWGGPVDPTKPRPPTVVAGFRLLFAPKPKLPRAQERKPVAAHSVLTELLAKTPFKLLDNRTQTLELPGGRLNITGVGDLWAGQCCPAKAFDDYDSSAPGIVLCHNPDGSALLQESPAELILSGHTHGGQINLPWMWKKFCLLDNMALKRGRQRVGAKTVYINRGVGAVFPFRWFSTPELTEFTLES